MSHGFLYASGVLSRRAYSRFKGLFIGFCKVFARAHVCWFLTSCNDLGLELKQVYGIIPGRRKCACYFLWNERQITTGYKPPLAGIIEMLLPPVPPLWWLIFVARLSTFLSCHALAWLPGFYALC